MKKTLNTIYDRVVDRKKFFYYFYFNCGEKVYWSTQKSNYFYNAYCFSYNFIMG
jgi:hypothetical protein